MANQSCPQGDLWYTCTAGGYRGCCDKNPCNTGSCPRDSSYASSASATKTSNPDSVTSILIATTTHTAPPHTGTPTDSTSPSAPTEKRISTAAVVGGVVGGIAMIILLALLLFLFLKHRRRRNWMNHAHIHRSVSSRNPDRETTLKTSNIVPPFFSPLASNPPTPRAPTNNFSFFSPSIVGTNAANTCLSPINEPSPTRAPPVPPLPVQPIHNFATRSTRSATQLQSTPQEIPSNRAKELEAPPPILGIPHEHSPPNQRRLNTTTELPDTGFYRQRAELPAQCQRELINVPLNQRPSHIGLNSSKAPSLRSFPLPPNRPANRSSNQTLLWPKQHPSKTPSPISPLSPGPSHTTPSKVITTDGVILGANLDRFSAEYRREVPDVRQGRAEPQSQAHVMSFMDFEQGKRSNAGSGNGGGGIGALDSLIRPPTSPHIVARRRAHSTVCVQTDVDPFQDERNVHKVSPLEDGVSPLGEGPPAYGDAHDVSPVREHKTPAGTYQVGNGRFG